VVFACRSGERLVTRRFDRGDQALGIVDGDREFAYVQRFAQRPLETSGCREMQQQVGATAHNEPGRAIIRGVLRT